MNILEEFNRAIEEEQEMLPSDGAKIAYAIDHFGMTIDEISECARKAELTPTGVVEWLTSVERTGHTASEAVEFLKQYGEETEVIAEEQKLAEYEKKSAAGRIADFRKAVEESKTQQLLRTGFNTLDQVFDGGLYEGLYIVGAIPSLGKTTMVMQIADFVARQQNDVLIFSLEMSANELIAKSLSRLTVYCMNDAHATQSDLKTARGISDGRRYEHYSHAEQLLIGLAYEAYSTFNRHIFIEEGMGGIGINDVYEKVRKHVAIRKTAPMVIIDYIQILAPFDVRATDKQNVDKSIKTMKEISRVFHTPVIGISSFNRSTYNSKANFGAFKESGSLEYGGDVIMGLQLRGAGNADFDSTEEKNKNPRNVEAVILKNRNGRTGDIINFDYFPQYNIFRDRGMKPPD